jgi:two-component system, LytTR family, response regulator
MKLRTIIVDDEPIARDRLRRLLARHPQVEIVDEYGDGKSAIAGYPKRKPNLLFLDIQMPGMNGFDVIDELQPKHAAAVFVTAYDNYAIRAFEACALDYLLKPVAPDRLSATIARATEFLSRRAPDVVREKAARFQVRSGQTTTFVAPEEIDWIEADGNYAILHVGAKGYLFRATMSALSSQLDPASFLRVSRSAIVNLSRIQELQATRAHQHFALLHNGQKIGVTLGMRELQQRLRSAR